MPKSPGIVVQVSDNKFLSRWLHCVVLKYMCQQVNNNIFYHNVKRYRFLKHWSIRLTSGGNSFSAALRGTEKPPCVLVSLAVKVLQKNSLGCLLGFSPKSGTGNTSFSWGIIVNRTESFIYVVFAESKTEHEGVFSLTEFTGWRLIWA